MAETWMARVERRLKALEEWQEDQRQHNEAAEAENAVRDHALAEMASRVDSLSSRVDGCALRSELATATAERASLSSRVDGLAATAAELRAAIETLRLDVVGAENQCTAVNTWRIQFDARLRQGVLFGAEEQTKRPTIGNVDEAMKELRAAGLDAWDEIPDPAAFLKDMRG